MTPVGIGIIGCGAIADAYFLAGTTFPILRTVACADLDPARSQAKATQWGVPRACTVAELLADPAVELVVNLTIPQAHAPVDRQALEAGKHVYSEKPLAVDLAEAQGVLALAAERGLRVGCAPDTQLCGAVQTARALIDSGTIGRPIAAHANIMLGGHESWHPHPAFYYQVGGGPMLDMGVYALSALTTLLGPVAQVAGMARRTWPTRTITSAPERGRVIPVEVDTHIACLLGFANGTLGTLVASFDIRTAYTAPAVEILGEHGSVALPCGASKQVRLSLLEDKGGWRKVPFTHPYVQEVRGVGVADMATAIRTGRPHRANGAYAAHTLAIMQAALTAERAGGLVPIAPCERPAAMARLPEYELDP